VRRSWKGQSFSSARPFCLWFGFQQSQLLCLHSVSTQTVPNQKQSEFPVFYSTCETSDAGLFDFARAKIHTRNGQRLVESNANSQKKKAHSKMMRVANVLRFYHSSAWIKESGASVDGT
jgi:hypothetical protein